MSSGMLSSFPHFLQIVQTLIAYHKNKVCGAWRVFPPDGRCLPYGLHKCRKLSSPSFTGEGRLLFTTAGIGPTLMLVVWAFYVLVLLFEGRLFKVLFRGEAQRDTAKVFAKLTAFHWIVLGLSL
ncbi:MAG: hypothetical protein K8I29_14260, partial [Alphaproteobacteria bacterium]|nr:hypothetical protein [Candidatus Nitrobium versatile]